MLIFVDEGTTVIFQIIFFLIINIMLLHVSDGFWFGQFQFLPILNNTDFTDFQQLIK